jgi:hypothetical protein
MVSVVIETIESSIKCTRQCALALEANKKLVSTPRQQLSVLGLINGYSV